MSGPLKSLNKVTRLPNGQFPSRMNRLHNREKTILRTNSEEDKMADVTWTPPDTWMTEVSNFTTTDENFGWRKARALMVLKFLRKETAELMEQPKQYITDIWYEKSVLLQKYGHVLFQIYGCVLFQKYGRVLFQKYGHVLFQKYGRVLFQMYGRVLCQKYERAVG